jgi:hypothetical protein
VSTYENAELDAEVLAHDARAGERLVDELYGFLGRFVSYPTEHAHVAHALWIMHTHLMNCWESTPRLAFLSAEPASGKTRALEVTELLVPNPVSVVNVSVAYLFRKVGSDDGVTVLFDEIDTIFGPKAKENEDIRGLLNAGHRRGATTGRCVARGSVVYTEEIPAYAAVALAGLGWLPDTLLSRSIIIRMRRRHAGERVEQFRRRLHAAGGFAIRDKIAAWSAEVSPQIRWPELPSEIADRDADVWESLIAIADAVGGSWPARARVAAVTLVTESKEVEPSLGIKLLSDIRQIFGSADAFFSKSLLEALHGLQESPWADIRGKPLDERGLGQRLRQYGVKSKTVRVNGITMKGYTRGDFVDVWARYISAAPATSVTRVTSVTPGAGSSALETSLGADVTLVTDVTHPGGGGRACAFCQGGAGPFCEASLDNKLLTICVRCKDDYRA